jgi:hypothetical protein
VGGYSSWFDWHTAALHSASGEESRGAIARRRSAGWAAAKTRNLADKVRARVRRGRSGGLTREVETRGSAWARCTG